MTNLFKFHYNCLGAVLCGVVGIKRFRFDVWSHDVLKANELESSGLPGKVHISEETYNLVSDRCVTFISFHGINGGCQQCLA